MIFNYLANNVLKLVTAKEKTISGSGKCYLALATDAPTADGVTLNEIPTASYPSYERIQISINAALEYTDKWGTVEKGVVTNSEEFTSRECTEEGGWPEASHFILFDAKTGGNPLAADLLRDPNGDIDETTGLRPAKKLTVEYGKVAVFKAGTLQLTLG